MSNDAARIYIIGFHADGPTPFLVGHVPQDRKAAIKMAQSLEAESITNSPASWHTRYTAVIEMKAGEE